MGFWSVESFGSLSKKQLSKKPVCPHCGKPAKFSITQVEHDYEGDLTDCESYPICRACARPRLEGPFKRNPRPVRRQIRLQIREEEARRAEMMRTNPELVKQLDRLGVAI